MAELARDYHDAIQKDETEEDPERKLHDIQAVLEFVEGSSGVPGMEDLGRETTEEEVIVAMKDSKKGKAAGLDGIPTELWQKLHTIALESAKKNKETDDVPLPVFNITGVLTIIYNDIRKNRVVAGTGFS
ncbi:hypothetical protein C8F01DRAFT_937942, partial [Mycena amicta]